MGNNGYAELDDLDDEDNPFEWYYQQDDEEEEYRWTEMSYNRFDRKTTWDDLEPTEEQLFLMEG